MTGRAAHNTRPPGRKARGGSQPLSVKLKKVFRKMIPEIPVLSQIMWGTMWETLPEWVQTFMNLIVVLYWLLLLWELRHIWEKIFN